MRRERSERHPAARQPGPARRIHEEAHDAYGLRGKLREPTACSECGALYREGRWIWGSPPADAHRVVCPACRRIADDYPDGSILVSGAFAAGRREEILALARHQEEREKAEHPLNRILRTSDEDAGLRITTTRRRLARAIGRALERAYGGELTATSDEENLLRLHWKRD